MTSMKRNRPSFKNRRIRNYNLIPTGFGSWTAEVGEHVKIGFVNKETGQTEWMWLEVVKKSGKDYVGILCNTGFSVNARAGDRIAFPDECILTTWDECPLRAVQDLAPLGLGFEAIDTLRAYEAATGKSRRDAVAELLSQFETERETQAAAKAA